MEFDFKLTFRVPEHLSGADWLMNRLAETGCTDTLVGLGAPGQVELEFRREGANLEDAILSAMADVRIAVPGAVLTVPLHQALTNMPNVGSDDDFERSRG